MPITPGLLNNDSNIWRKHDMLRKQLLLDRLAIFIRIYLLRSCSIRHFSVAPYITICPSTETYFGLYLRGAISAVTGIYLFRLLLNIIFFALRSFFTLTNSAYPDEMPHVVISPVCKCKKHVRKIYFTIEMQPNIFFKVISCSIHVCIHLL